MKNLNFFKYVAVFAAFLITLFVAGCGDGEDHTGGGNNNGDTVGNDNENPIYIENPTDIPYILIGVKFQLGRAILDVVSYTYLDDVIKSLRSYPEMKFEIQGYTDNVGSKNGNIKLSQDRADTVKAYFVRNGLTAGRFRAVGYGPDMPIANNDTDSGRELNRRIELKRFL